MKVYMLSLLLVSLVLISGCSQTGQIARNDYEEALKAREHAPVNAANGTGPYDPAGLPEAVLATVRDIIDGDTIDVGLNATDLETGENVTLPEFGPTGHARIRLLGINAPEKSPKGEIVCSDVEIYNVRKEYADEARDVLLPLNDKNVILRIDPLNQKDTHGRILASVEYDGEDVCLSQIRRGLACAYYREDNKYVNKTIYTAATLEANETRIGMWGVEAAAAAFSIMIDSIPSNAKLYIDGVYTHHLTPSDEDELEDVMILLAPGQHVFRADKSGTSGEVAATITSGANTNIIISLLTAETTSTTQSNACIEDWGCSEWSECSQGERARICADVNSCGTESNKPDEIMNCEEQPQEEQQPSEEPKIIITEVMYDSLSSYDQHGEFIELYNDGQGAIDLSGWSISDENMTDNLTGFNEGPTILEAGEYAVITGDNTNVTVSSGAIHLTVGHGIICSYGLKNSGERVTFYDLEGREADSIDYGGHVCETGHSLEKTQTNWSCSLVENGTPGYANSA